MSHSCSSCADSKKLCAAYVEWQNLFRSAHGLAPLPHPTTCPLIPETENVHQLQPKFLAAENFANAIRMMDKADRRKMFMLLGKMLVQTIC